MSQQKVDRYKAEKANRKKNIKRQKIRGIISRIAVAVIALAIVVYIGLSIYLHFNPIETTTAFQNVYTEEELASILEEEGVLTTENTDDTESDDTDTSDDTESDDTDADDTSDDTSDDDASDDGEESGEDTTSSDEE